jgi:hypothetical protein
MNLSSFSRVSLLIAILLVAACSSGPVVVDTKQPEVLTILPDGTMRLMGRLLPAEDVVIYPDGYGGEKAAVKVRIEPLHPAFYRDSIIVKRIGPTLVTDN